MNKKKFLLAILALMLVCSLSVAGTLAYLTASQNGAQTVVNTFVAAGGGELISGTTTEEALVDGLQDGFFLVETAVEYTDGAYAFAKEGNKVITNTYDKVVPNMTIPKDPELTVDVADGADVYIFVRIIDTTAENLTYTRNDDWKEATGLPEGVYVYKNEIITGDASTELDNIPVLTNNQVVVINAGSENKEFTDVDDQTAGLQLGELKFEAYVCQAGGFTDAAAAYNTCFGTSNNGN